MGLFDWIFRQGKEKTDDPAVLMSRISGQIFPRGQRDVDEMVDQIIAALPGRLTRERALELGRGIRVIHLVATDRTEERLLIHLRPKTPELTEAQRIALARAAVGQIAMVGNEDSGGSSPDTAIVIKAQNSMEGISQEYQHLEKRFGSQNNAWKMLSRGHRAHGDRVIDWFNIQLEDGSHRIVYFDITSFYGK